MGLALHGGRGVAETEGARSWDFCQRGSSKQLLGDTRLQSRVVKQHPRPNWPEQVAPSAPPPAPRSISGFVTVLRRNGDRVGTRPSAWPQSLPCRPGGRERPRDWLKVTQLRGSRASNPTPLSPILPPVEILPASVFMIPPPAQESFGIQFHRFSGSFSGRALVRVRERTEAAHVRG